MPKFTGETIEKAIEAGLLQMNCTRADVKIDIINEGKKGILGFGKKEAQILIERNTKNKVEPSKIVKTNTNEVETSTSKETYELTNLADDKAITALAIYLTDITKDLGTPSTIKVSRNKERIIFNLETEKKGLLIGKHGKLINAIQYLAQVYIHRIAKNRLSIVVNVGDYREKREAVIERLANQTVKKLRVTGQPIFLEPMPAFERKQIHSILANEPDISTHSEGNEPYRYLVVELKK